jgi:succinate-semialdehyde dehydrogenase / glutarate-semialdehyde dehydrogenase
MVLVDAPGSSHDDPDLLRHHRTVNALVRRIQAGTDAATIDVQGPFTGEVIAELPISNPADVHAAAVRARSAQVAWAARPISERIGVLLRFHDLLLDRRHEVLDLIQLETGKARRDANEEVLDVALNIQHYARIAPRELRPRRLRGALPVLTRVRQWRHPVGVVGVIAPWNYPLTLAASDAVPGLVAGNAVIVKPDVQTSFTAAWVASLMAEAGLPDGLFQVVTGDGPVIGPAVIDAVDHVIFTGSTATGRIVAEQCARRLIGCTLELGGKNAMIVRSDVDPAKAAAIATRAMFANTGQLCISMERIYVHAAVFDVFVAELVDRVRALRIGTTPGWGADIGPLINDSHLGRVQAHVDDAVARGAQVLTGGRARPDIGPLAFEPTLLAGVTEEMTLCREETFGPVAAVYRVMDDDEAVWRANDSDYGLNASILSADVRQARRLAVRLNAGSVNINEGYAATWGSVAAPIGGRRDSGLGYRHGAEGLLATTESQVIASQHLMGFDPPFGLDDARWGRILSTAVGLMRPWRPTGRA